MTTTARPSQAETPAAAPPGRLRLALAGLLTGIAGLASGTATAWLLRAELSPVDAVGSAVRDLTPGPVAVRLVHLVQHADKPLLVGGTLVVVLAVCTWAGAESRRHPLLPDVVFVLLGVIGLLATIYEDDAGAASALALVVGLVTWIVVLRVLAGAPGPVPAGAQAAPDPGRRAFLVRSAGVLVASAAVLWLGRWAGRGRRAVEQARRLLRLPVTAGDVPDGAEVGPAGIAPWRTSNGGFYQVSTTISPPSIEPASWRLRVHGMVDNPLTLSYDDLADRQLTEAWVTLCCVSNEVGGDLIGNAWWSGVLARDILAEAGVQPGADAVKQTSHDGWTCGTPIAALTDDRNALLALAMNGDPLPVAHGFPVRMVVPGLYGYVSATKWLVDLEVTTFSRFTAYWTERGWSEKGPVKTESRIDVPRSGQKVHAGAVSVGGSAWAQHTGIAAVEFRLDGGPWQPATLGAVPDTDTWVQWTGTLKVDAGKHELAVRATDKSGYTQTAVRTDVVPNGATGWHTVRFSAE